MFAFRTLLAFTAIAGAFANPLQARQATNTNEAIHEAVTVLDMVIHQAIPNIRKFTLGMPYYLQTHPTF